MSGHSKWSTIKHQKGAADAKRSNLFTKLANTVTIAARGGADPDMNFTLRLTIDRAKAANMPKANIDRAIARGSGAGGGANFESITYEAYGQAGIAILIEAATDNRNRTSSDVKAVINKFSGRFASPGSVSYLFEQVGLIKIKSEKLVEEAELKIIDSGAKDYDAIESGFLVYTEPRELDKVRKTLVEKNFEIEEASLSWEPKSTAELDGDQSAKVIKLLEALDELDDVTAVYSNLG